ncbi:MAG: WD40 repeat domain-containing protein [Candidatus Lokiarchaeia archaeon]
MKKKILIILVLSLTLSQFTFSRNNIDYKKEQTKGKSKIEISEKLPSFPNFNTLDEPSRTFTGHRGGVSSVCISSDSRYIVSGSYDDTIKLWNLHTGELIRTFSGHRDGVFSVCISSDSRYIVSGSEDNTIKLWNLHTGELIRTFTGHKRAVNSVCISSDSRYIVSGSDDHTVKLWDLHTGNLIRTFIGHYSIVTSVCISSNSRYIVSGDIGDIHDDTIKLWDLHTGDLIRSITGHTSQVSSVCINSDSKYIISASWDQTIKLWDLHTGELIRTFTGHTWSVRSLGITSDSKYIVSGDAGDHVKLWDLHTGELIRTLDGHTSISWPVYISSDSRYVVSGSRDNTIKLWKIYFYGYVFNYAGSVVTTSNGDTVSIPFGTFVKIIGNTCVLPIKGKIDISSLKGFLPSIDPLLILKSTPVLSSIKGGKLFNLHPGTILEETYYAKDENIFWIETLSGKSGWISEANIAKLNKIDYFLYSLQDTFLEKYPQGEIISELKKGEILQGICHCPYIDYFYLTNEKGDSGWISNENVNNLRFKEVNFDLVVKHPGGSISKGVIGEELTSVDDGEIVSATGYSEAENKYQIKLSSGEKGWINKSSVLNVAYKTGRRWVKIDKGILLKSPDGVNIKELAKNSFLNLEAEAGEYIIVEVPELESTGWIRNEEVTDIRPDLFFPILILERVKKTGSTLDIEGTVFEDTEVKSLAIFGTEPPRINKKISVGGLPFSPDDIYNFRTSLFIPEGINEFDVQIEDKSGKIKKIQLNTSGEIVSEQDILPEKEEKPIIKSEQDIPTTEKEEGKSITILKWVFIFTIISLALIKVSMIYFKSVKAKRILAKENEVRLKYIINKLKQWEKEGYDTTEIKKLLKEQGIKIE